MSCQLTAAVAFSGYVCSDVFLIITPASEEEVGKVVQFGSRRFWISHSSIDQHHPDAMRCDAVSRVLCFPDIISCRNPTGMRGCSRSTTNTNLNHARLYQNHNSFGLIESPDPMSTINNDSDDVLSPSVIDR